MSLIKVLSDKIINLPSSFYCAVPKMLLLYLFCEMHNEHSFSASYSNLWYDKAVGITWF